MEASTKNVSVALAVATILGSMGVRATATPLYWDTTAGTGNGVGGSGTWGTTFSTTSTGDATLTTAATTDDLYFEGTAGTVTLGANQTGNSFTFNTTGYRLAADSTTQRNLIGPVTLGAGVNLIIGDGLVGTTTTRAVGLNGAVTGGANSQITLNATATGNNLTRLEVGAAGGVSVPIVISGTGNAAIIGTVSGGVTFSGTITGTGTTRLNLGPGGGNTGPIFSNTINNGTAPLRMAGGAGSGGNGFVTLSGSGNTWGDTELMNGGSASLRMGTTNALPNSTRLIFSFDGSNGKGNFELNGFNTTVGQLTYGPPSTPNTPLTGYLAGYLKNANSTTAAKFTISGSDTTARPFAGTIQNNGTNQTSAALSLERAGAGSTTLTGFNTYSGPTLLNGGTLVVGSGVFNTQTATAPARGTATATLTGLDPTVVSGLSVGQPLLGTGIGNNNYITAINSSTSITITSSASVSANPSTITFYTGSALGIGDITFGGGTLQYATGINADYSTISGNTSRIKNSTGAIRVDTNSNNVTFGGVIGNSNVGGLNKLGLGTLTLNAANLYTGTTTVTTGTLAVGSVGSLDNSSIVDVKSGATFDVSGKSGFSIVAGQTLMGNGSITGPIIINGTLATGASIGQLTFSNNLTLTGASTLEINDVTNTADLNQISGALVYGGSLSVSNLGIGSSYADGQVFDLFNFSSQSGNFTGFTLPTLPGTLAWKQFDNVPFDYSTGQLVVTAIPEPTAAFTVLGVAGPFLLRRRRI